MDDSVRLALDDAVPKHDLVLGLFRHVVRDHEKKLGEQIARGETTICDPSM